MNIDDKQELTIKTIHLEYKVLRTELRLNWTFTVACIFAAVLIALVGLIVSGFVDEFYRMLILLVTSVGSLFFTLLGLVFCAMVVNIALRLTEIEERLNNILGDTVVSWETSAGLFPKLGDDVFRASVYKFLVKSGVMCFVIGIVPVAVNLWQGFDILRHFIGLNVILPEIAYGLAAGITVFLGYKFWYQKTWEKIKV